MVGKMNKEDYVSIEVAKLLKEKGYNIPCKSSRKKSGELIFYDIEQSLDNMLSIGDECYEYLCPTLYEAQKWLREKYHIAVNIYNVLSTNGVAWKWEINNIEKCKSVIDRSCAFIGFDTYEEALNAGILEALKILWI